MQKPIDREASLKMCSDTHNPYHRIVREFLLTAEECITRLDAIRHEIVPDSRDHFALAAGIAALYEMENGAPAVNRWIPCSEMLPDHYDDILFCERDRTIHKGYMYWDGTFIENYVKFRKSDIVAWMPMPDAYEPTENE